VKKIFFLLVVMFLTTGCMQKNVSNVTYDSASGNIIKNEYLQERIAIVNHRSREKNNLLEMQVALQNLTDDNYELEYKVTWLDADKFKIGETPWLPITLNGKEQRNIEQIAHNPQVADYKFQLRFKQEGE
jgi:uncharacterized protein YcfL